MTHTHSSLVFVLLNVGLLTTANAIEPGSKQLGDIWFVGDSITQGNADGDSRGSPRLSLYQMLNEAGYEFTYTGHYTANTDGLPRDELYVFHSGVSGAVIGTGVAGRAGITQRIIESQWLESGRLAVAKPEIILLMLGTNDMIADIDVENAPDRLSTLIETVYAQADIGDPTLLLASIPPLRRRPGDIRQVAAFNAAIPDVVEHFQNLGKDVHFVDQFTPLNDNYLTLMRSDHTHTNAAGNESLAQQWFETIEALAVPEPSSLLLLACAAAVFGSRRPSSSILND